MLGCEMVVLVLCGGEVSEWVEEGLGVGRLCRRVAVKGEVGERVVSSLGALCCDIFLKFG